MSGYIGNSVTSQSADSTVYLPARQTVLIGAATSAGVPNFMAAGTGLRVALSASATPMAIAFANGFGSYGASDFVTRLTANAADMTGADLSAAAVNFITASYVSNGSVTWNSTIVPPQYGPTFDQTKQSLLRFAGADASTTILDDYGNTWTAIGNAQVDTAVQIDGLNTLLLDGTGDYVECTNFTTMGSGSWTMEAKVRWNTLPAATTQNFFATTNGTQGVRLGLNDTAGTKKLSLTLSSDGATGDIAATLLGTTWVPATGTTYHFALVFDQLAGKYFVYRDGVADAALTTTSTSRISGITKMRYGDSGVGASQLNGAMAGCRFAQCCRYPNGVTFTAPTISTFTVEGHWFDTVGYQMWEATAASGVAGTNPTFTQRNRVFVGEADTSAAAVTAVRNYAYQGRYISADTTIPVAGTRTAFSANLGVIPLFDPIVMMRNYTIGSAMAPGMIVRASTRIDVGDTIPMHVSIDDRNTLSIVQGATTTLVIANRLSGAFSTPTAGDWKMFVIANRGW